MKRTLLYLAILCFTAAFSQKITELFNERIEDQPHNALETYDNHKAYRANLEKKKEHEKKLYTYAAAKRLKNYRYGDYLIVIVDSTGIKSGCGIDFKTIQTVKKDGLLKFHSFEGHWVKVTAVDTGKTGYIYYKDIK